MENRINIAELLKDCPKGMELDCLMFENLEFDHIDKDNGSYSIICCIKTEWGYNTHTFTEYGCYSTEKYSKCVIFPKGKTTWEGFVPPCRFKDGDIVINASKEDSNAFVYAGEDEDYYHSYVGLTIGTAPELHTDKSRAWVLKKSGIRYATEEEKQKLFKAIKEEGYKWNAETKTLAKLVKPKFKVGDRIWCINKHFQYDVTELTDTHYTLVEVENKFQYIAPIIEDKDWELVPNKFDINNLVPFESRVLVRDENYHENIKDGSDVWRPAIFGLYSSKYLLPFNVVGGLYYMQCIPYEGNEHLRGKKDDCDEFYKTWE